MRERDITKLFERLAVAPDPEKNADLFLKITAEVRQQKEYRQKWVAIVLSAFAVLLSLVVAVIGFGGLILQGKDSYDLQQRDIKLREKEYSVRFYEQQVEAYSELCDLVARTMIKGPTANSSQEFDILIAGKLFPFADNDIASHAVSFNDLLRKKLGIGSRKFAEGNAEVSGSDIHLGDPGIDLIRQCRRSMRKAFPNIEIGDELGGFSFGVAAPKADPESTPVTTPTLVPPKPVRRYSESG